MKGKLEDVCFCDFCGESQYERGHMIAGPSVHICDVCSEMCMLIVLEQRHGKRSDDGKQQEE